MQNRKSLKKIFKKGSRTFYTSSLFFEKEKKEDISKLYAFVRTIDDYVDSIPPRKKQYYNFKDNYCQAIKGIPSEDHVINSFISLKDKYNFNNKWIKAFFKSMEDDLNGRIYKTIHDTLDYMHGSAEIIGLIMHKILELPEEAVEYAKELGKSFQYINFIRDIKMDHELGRNYFPHEDMKKYYLNNLSETHVKTNSDDFIKFINFQIKRYFTWLKKAEKGFKFIPRKNRIPIKTASDIFIWTANTIKKDPFIIYKKTVKPSRLRIYPIFIKNYFLG